MKEKYKKFLVFGGIIFILILVFTPIHESKAIGETFGLAIPEVISGVANFITGLPQQFVLYVLQVVWGVASALLGWLTTALGWIVNIPVIPQGGVLVVTTTWKILRDMANMLFIVVLVISAFATLFDIEAFGYKGYNFSSIIMRLIIAAVLINFSLVIGQVIIDGAQVLNNVFLRAMGDIAGRLANGLNPAQLTPGVVINNAGGAVQAADSLAGGMTGLIFAIIFVSSMAVAVFTAMAVALVRIPILWLLLIISPLAWIASTFPMFRKQFNNWWRQFIGWNLFLPLFLFFLYIALVLLSAQGQITTALMGDAATRPILTGYPITMQLILFYVMVEMALVGGTGMAIKFSTSLAGKIGGVAGWAENRAKRLPVFGSLEAAKNATRARLGQVGETRAGRIFGYVTGSEASQKQKEEYWASRLGVKSTYETQKDFVDKAGKKFTTLENDLSIGKIKAEEVAEKARRTKANDPEGFAYKKLAAKMGRLDNQMFANTLRELNDNPFAARDFVNTAKEAKFSDVDPKVLMDAAMGEGQFADIKGVNTTLLPARKELLKYVQSDAKVASRLKPEQFNKAVSLFGGHTTAEGAAFMKDVGKARPDLTLQYTLSNNAALKRAAEKYKERYKETDHDAASLSNDSPEMKDRLIKGHYADAVNVEAKELANMGKDTWANKDFQQALFAKIRIPSQSEMGERDTPQRRAYDTKVKSKRQLQNRLLNNLEFAPGGSAKSKTLNDLIKNSEIEAVPPS